MDAHVPIHAGGLEHVRLNGSSILCALIVFGLGFFLV